MTLNPVIAEALARIRAEARAAGYAEGFAAGREAERAELLAALMDAAVETQIAEDRRREGGTSAPNTGAPGPSPAVVAGGPPVSPSLPGAAPADAGAPAAPAVDLAALRAASGRGYRTAARAAVLDRDWPAGVPVGQIRTRMNALPGVPVPHSQAVSAWAKERGLRRPAGFGRGRGAKGAPVQAGASVDARPPVSPEPPVAHLAAASEPVAAAPEPVTPVAATPDAPWQTAERRAVLERHYPDGIPVAEIREMMAKLPGGPMPPVGVSAWAKALGLARPELPPAPADKPAERIKRRCLSCDRNFIAEGKFGRLCLRCRKVSGGIAA